MSRKFFQPETLNEALICRRDNNGSALLAGGTDLVVAIHKDRGPEGNIIDLSRIRELRKIKIQGDEINVGAMVTFTTISDSKILNEKAKLLCLAAEAVGSPQIRNRGTIGGNICNASPAADAVPALVCLEAKVVLQSIYKEEVIKKRELTLEDFILGPNKTLLEDNEILTNVVFKMPSEDTRMNFRKIGRRNSLAIARLNGACLIKMDRNLAAFVNLVIGAAASKPERFKEVEDYLKGRELNEESLAKAGMLASDHILRQTGRRSSSTYKLPVIARFVSSLIESTLDKEG